MLYHSQIQKRLVKSEIYSVSVLVKSEIYSVSVLVKSEIYSVSVLVKSEIYSVSVLVKSEIYSVSVTLHNSFEFYQTNVFSLFACYSCGFDCALQQPQYGRSIKQISYSRMRGAIPPFPPNIFGEWRYLTTGTTLPTWLVRRHVNC
jgi:hypothetical protein